MEDKDLSREPQNLTLAEKYKGMNHEPEDFTPMEKLKIAGILVGPFIIGVISALIGKVTIGTHGDLWGQLSTMQHIALGAQYAVIWCYIGYMGLILITGIGFSIYWVIDGAKNIRGEIKEGYRAPNLKGFEKPHPVKKGDFITRNPVKSILAALVLGGIVAGTLNFILKGSDSMGALDFMLKDGVPTVRIVSVIGVIGILIIITLAIINLIQFAWLERRYNRNIARTNQLIEELHQKQTTQD